MTLGRSHANPQIAALRHRRSADDIYRVVVSRIENCTLLKVNPAEQKLPSAANQSNIIKTFVLSV